MTDGNALLTAQHRTIDEGLIGLVDGSGSRREFDAAVRLLRRHIYVEETFLFPAVAKDASRAMPLAVMHSHHGLMWPHLTTLVTLLEANAPLDDMLADADALVALQRLHNDREEESIYSRANLYPPDDGSPDLADAFATLALPTGWKCREAP